MTHKRRIAIFCLIFVLCISASVGYVWLRVRQLEDKTDSASAKTDLITPNKMAGIVPKDISNGTLSKEGSDSSVSLSKPRFVIFRNMAEGNQFGQLSTVSLDDLSQPRVPVGLSCERSYFANGYGVCLTAKRGSITTYHAYVFDRSFQWHQDLPPLKGIPSRARVSPDGRYVAITVFVSGHSYAPGGFATQVDIYRTLDGSRVAELDQFTVERDGKVFSEIDFNFWGVTFAGDGNRFYATLGTGGQNYLIEGDLATRHARIIHAGVECPSLSPDGQRVAFKRLSTNSGWHIYVFNLSTGVETMLAETRSVDDQVEWLDDKRILYVLNNEIWVMPSDGGGSPAVFLANAYSPAVVR
jgi:WD40-like Beta Propeller Repeat